MKNKYSKSDGVFKNKKFYIALYSCVGVVLVLAATISFSNLNFLSDKEKPQENLAAQLGTETPIQDAVKQNVPSISDSTSQSVNSGQLPEVKLGDTKGVLEKIPLSNEETSMEEVQSAEAVAPKTVAQQATIPAEKPKQETVLSKPAENRIAESYLAESKTAEVEAVENNTAQKPADALAEPVFNTFSGEVAMNWPVVGEVVMDYSMDRVVYDKTLEQYRTNDNICITAQVGTQVKAAAEGVVKSISVTKEAGNKVVIDHGNGWETTYSQLQENILVKEGDVVKTGQVIGGVSNPSIYGVLLGNHLAFKVTKNDLEVDPKTVLLK